MGITGRLDHLDSQILMHLQRDGRSSYTALAALCGVSEGTIRKRMQRLEDRGAVRIVGVTNPAKTGMDTVAVVWLRVERGRLLEVVSQITALPEAHYVAYTTGASDIVAIVTLESQEALVGFLARDLGSIEGLSETETSMVLRVYKQAYNWSPWPHQPPGFAAQEETGEELDEIDLKIIRYLQRDGRMTFVTIADELGITESTVRRRVTSLLERDILKIAAVINPAQVGRTTLAMIGIKVERQRLGDVARTLASMADVRYLALSTGKYDLIIEVVQESNEKLLDFLVDTLEDIPGILRTDTHLLLKLSKESYDWGVAKGVFAAG
ncbi:MAG: Lrp/AsnC family transcriptional regulator [Firmicutes bacterium]|nr:Lrp/AsnC family transcriptional regulator [Bacillota bacterium]